MAVRTGVMGSLEPALVFPVVAFHCSLQELQTLKTKCASEKAGRMDQLKDHGYKI